MSKSPVRNGAFLMRVSAFVFGPGSQVLPAPASRWPGGLRPNWDSAPIPKGRDFVLEISRRFQRASLASQLGLRFASSFADFCFHFSVPLW